MTSLIISQNDDNLALIEQLIKENITGHAIIANSGNEARRIISGGTKPDLTVINAPLPDEFGQELAVMTTEMSRVIFICRNEISEDIFHIMPPEVIILTKPFSREDFKNSIGKFSEMHGMKRENNDILTKIDEMRVINRAKSTLMEYLGFTEPQAHRYIEKQAMNNRQTRRETAEKILNTYKK